MQGRLKSSKQWSPFPTELCEQTQEVLHERFAEEYALDDANFVVEGFIYKEEIIGRYGLQIKNQLKQHNFEVSIEFNSEKEKALEVIQSSMDVIEHLWTELLEEDLEDADLSKTWQSLPYKKKMYFYRYSTVNSSLEQEANKLLEQYEKKLIYDAPEEDLEATPSQSDEGTLH